MSKFNFEENLLALSTSKNVDDAVEEWIFTVCLKGDNQCICNREVGTLYRYRNTTNGNMINTGSGCKKKFGKLASKPKSNYDKRANNDKLYNMMFNEGIYGQIIDLFEYSDDNNREFLEIIKENIDKYDINDLNRLLDHSRKVIENNTHDDIIKSFRLIVNDIETKIKTKELIIRNIQENIERKKKEEIYKEELKKKEEIYKEELKKKEEIYKEELKKKEEIYKEELKKKEEIYKEELKKKEEIYKEERKKKEEIYKEERKKDSAILSKSQMVSIQPADWIENDIKFKYTVDVFGRTDKGEVAQVRLTGFQPYFYLRMVDGENSSQIQAALEQASGKQLRGIKITLESKLDAMRGFSGLKPINVWKLSFPAIWMFKTVQKTLKHSMRIGTRKVMIEDIFEANLPPFIRLFHEMDLSPASPFEFEADDYDPDEDVNVDVFYEVNYADIKPASSQNIPLLIAAYDIETYSESGNFPVASNASDEIIQIGLAFRYSNDLLKDVKRFVFVSGTCTASQDPSVTFVACRNEKDLLDQFQRCIQKENPDAMCGYNTFGFDDGYIADRAEFRKIQLKLGRIDGSPWKQDYAKTEKKTFELASGKFAVRYLEMPGRLPIDLMLSVRREQNLDSYKLDNVSNVFLRDKVSNIVSIAGDRFEVHTKSTRGLFIGNLVRFDVVANSSNPYREGAKFKVIEVYPKKFVIENNYLYTFDDLSPEDIKKLEWSIGKDDIDVKDMFASHHGSADDRAVVAKYCIQDCDLVLTLMAKLDTLVNARGMADVCRVPIQYIFLRGQGIKIFSAVVYNATKRNQIIMTQESMEGDSSYEGAIVLPPKIGMYLDQPIAVLDFNSLYPSNMIAYNLSPDTLVYVKTYDARGKKVTQEGGDGEGFREDGYAIDEIGYDIYDDAKNPAGRVVCGFVQPKSGDPRTVGVLPLTLDILLKKRKETRKIMESVEDDAQKAVLNGLQLAYKVVANSVYGQCGSRTSPIRKMEVAACTTAVGRQKIYDAKSIVESEFGGEVIYGDTDSIFIKFATKDLAESIRLGQESAARITSLCRKAHKIEYEKTMFPFILFCRKRYVGMLYETDVTKCYRKTMGVALKRRDNAPIVKDIFGGALDILMEKRDIRPAQEFVKDMLVKLIKNEFPLEKFIITKQLRDDYAAMKEDYKGPATLPAHRVLANRMEQRDAGNAPQVGDRLPYIYVANRKDEKKQGDKIEHVDYVRAKGLKPDTDFYITNQVQNPVAQLFALAIDKLDGYTARVNYDDMLKEFMEDGLDEEEATLKVLDKKEKELTTILFLGASYLTKHKRGPMDMFLKRK